MPQKTKNENLIHIRLEYSEAIQSKKDVLSLQVEFLKTLQTIKTYHKIRSTELNSKIRLGKKIRELKSNILKLKKILPEIKIPKILKDDVEDETENKNTKQKKKSIDRDLDFQLKEIQDKLKSLE